MKLEVLESFVTTVYSITMYDQQVWAQLGSTGNKHSNVICLLCTCRHVLCNAQWFFWDGEPTVLTVPESNPEIITPGENYVFNIIIVIQCYTKIIKHWSVNYFLLCPTGCGYNKVWICSTMLRCLERKPYQSWLLFMQVLYPDRTGIWTGFVPLFRNKFPGLFQDSDWFFKASKIHINPYSPKISMLILITAFHTLHIL